MKGDSVVLKCSACDIELVELLMLDDDGDPMKVRASCPYCGDRSFIKEFNGRFAFGPKEAHIGSLITGEIMEITCHKK